MVHSSAIRRLFLTFVLSCVILAVFVVDDGAAAPREKPESTTGTAPTTPKNYSMLTCEEYAEYRFKLGLEPYRGVCGGLGGVKGSGSSNKECPPNMQANDDGECRPIAN